MDDHPLSHRLDRLPLTAFKPLFAALEAPPTGALKGVYQGRFTGPAWLRRSAGPALLVAGLGGWWGKEFDGAQHGINLVRRKGQYRRIFPLQLVLEPSAFDGMPVMAVHYLPVCPFPWPWVIDELRQVEPGWLLGMSYANAGFLRKIAFPFLLHSRELSDGPTI